MGEEGFFHCEALVVIDEETKDITWIKLKERTDG
jgi:hypothetical protein